jgi:hypothetical protein
VLFRSCYQTTGAKLILSCRITTRGHYDWFTLGGTLVCTIIKGGLPASHQALLEHLITQYSAISLDPRMATDGYSYDKTEFMNYYGTNGDNMWTMAAFRSWAIDLVHDTTILARANYDEWKFSMDAVSAPPYDPGFGSYLRNFLGFGSYIPSKYWPHEPMDTMLEYRKGWIQCANTEGTMQDYLRGLISAEPLMNMYIDLMELMSSGLLCTHPEIAVAYSMAPGEWHAPQVMALWPHVFLHANSPCTSDRPYLVTRLNSIFNENTTICGARPPSTDLEIKGRLPPHYLLARHVPCFTTAEDLSRLYYAVLADQWAGGRRGLTRYTQCLGDMLGPNDFMLRFGVPEDMIVDLDYLRGVGGIEIDDL